MPWILDTREYLDTVCELLKQGESSVAVPVAGGSMIPFLHHGDTCTWTCPGFPSGKDRFCSTSVTMGNISSIGWFRSIAMAAFGWQEMPSRSWNIFRIPTASMGVLPQSDIRGNVTAPAACAGGLTATLGAGCSAIVIV